MTTRSVKAMLSRMRLTDEDVGVVVANDGQELITIDDIYQFNEKSLEGLCWVFSEKLHIQSYLESLWSEMRYFGLLGNNHILFIILLYRIEG